MRLRRRRRGTLFVSAVVVRGRGGLTKEASVDWEETEAASEAMFAAAVFDLFCFLLFLLSWLSD